MTQVHSDSKTPAPLSFIRSIMPTHSILTFEFDLMCYIEACVAAAGILFICLTGWLDPLFSPRPSFSEICPFLVMPWRGILCPRATTFPFLSFSRKTTKKGQLLNSLALGVERVLDVDLARSFLIMQTRVFWHFFVFSVLIFSFRESWPSTNSPSTFSDGVSSKISTIPPLDDFHLAPLQNPFPESTNASSSE